MITHAVLLSNFDDRGYVSVFCNFPTSVSVPTNNVSGSRAHTHTQQPGLMEIPMQLLYLQNQFSHISFRTLPTTAPRSLYTGRAKVTRGEIMAELLCVTLEAILHTGKQCLGASSAFQNFRTRKKSDRYPIRSGGD